MNKCILMGRLTATPELKTTQSGINFVSFTLAVQRDFAKQGEERQTDFIDCTAWRNTAEFISKYFGKGSMMALAGQLQTRTYTDKNGSNRKAYEVLTENVYFTGGKTESRSTEVVKSPQNIEISVDDISDEDLPF